MVSGIAVGVRRPLLGAAASSGFALGVAVLAAGTAHAGKPKFHATGSLTVSYSDNILSAPEQPPPNVPNVPAVVEDVGIQYAPGVTMFYDTPRLELVVSYSHPMLLYVDNPLANAVGNSVQLLGLFAASPYDQLTTRFTIDHTTSGLANLGTASNETQPRVRPVDDTSMVSVNLLQTHSRTLSPSWAFQTAGTAGVTVPVEGGVSMFAGNLASGPELRLNRHAIGVAPTLAYSRPLASDDELGSGFLSSEQLVVGAEGRWAWDWTDMWSSQTSIGAVMPIQQGERSPVQPTGSAAVRFTAEAGYGASLQYARGYVPNLLTGQTYFSDTASFHANLPIHQKSRIELRTSAGFGFNRVIDLLRDVDTDVVNTSTVDASVGWYPQLYPHISLRYQYIKQFGAPPDQIVLANFSRHMVGLSVSYVFPPRLTEPEQRDKNRVDGREEPEEKRPPPK